MRASSHRSPPGGGNAATGLLFVGVVMAVLFGAGIAAVVASGSGPAGRAPAGPAVAQVHARATAATAAGPAVAGSAVAHRLVELVALRDAAFARRDPALLERVYAPESVNRRTDRASIAELRRQHARLLGLATSVQVVEASQAGPRRWTLLAWFACAPARLVGESGRQLEARRARRALLRFTLVLPAGGDQWRLERIAPAQPSN
jgi:hypothetical protein